MQDTVKKELNEEALENVSGGKEIDGQALGIKCFKCDNWATGVVRKTYYCAEHQAAAFSVDAREVE